MFHGARSGPRKNPNRQSLHDDVVAHLAEHLEMERGRHVVAYTNPGSEKNFSVDDGLWPDIVLIDAEDAADDDPTPVEIYEIETEDSVTNDEALRQWKPYADVGIPFTLVVPEMSVLDAFVLLNTYEIEARVIGFEQRRERFVYRPHDDE